MSEEMKKQETMEDYMKEIDASFSNFRDDDMLLFYGRKSFPLLCKCKEK